MHHVTSGFAGNISLDYNAEEKMSGEGEVKIVRPCLLSKTITSRNSNYEKKKYERRDCWKIDP